SAIKSRIPGARREALRLRSAPRISVLRKTGRPLPFRVRVIVSGVRFPLDEVIGIGVIIFPPVVGVPPKKFDCFYIFPKREHLEMCYIFLDPRQAPSTTISWDS